MRKLVAAVALAVALPAAARAEEFATSKDAELMVHQAVAFMKKEGREKALAAFSDPNGRFRYRDLYVMAYDLQGRCLAHGAKKDRIGKLLIEDKDADGKLFVKERVAIAKKYGKGWQEYKWENPVSHQIEQKVAYFELFDGIIVASPTQDAALPSRLTNQPVAASGVETNHSWDTLVGTVKTGEKVIVTLVSATSVEGTLLAIDTHSIRVEPSGGPQAIEAADLVIKMLDKELGIATK